MWLREQIEAIKRNDPAARSTAEVLLTYPGLHALAFHKVAHELREREMHLPARMVSHLGRFLTGIEIHPGAQIGERFFIDHGMGSRDRRNGDRGRRCARSTRVSRSAALANSSGKRHPTVGNNVVIGIGREGSRAMSRSAMVPGSAAGRSS